MKPEEIKIGDVFHDVNHAWTDGSTEIDMIHVVMSKDPIKKADGTYTKESFWSTSNYTWACNGYCGARVRQFNNEEILKMKKVGNLNSIISF